MKICVGCDKPLSCFGHWEIITTITVLSLVPAAADFLCMFLFCFFFLNRILVRNYGLKIKEKSKAEDLFQRLLLTLVCILWKHLRIPSFVGIAERLCMLRLSDFFVCLTFFSKQICQGCHNAIDPEVQRVTYNNFNWHATEECFLCSCCSKCLIGQKFMPVEGMVFCSVECKKKMMS